MSPILVDILDYLRREYMRVMTANGASLPFLTAEKLCHEKLYLDTDMLARVVAEDPTLLAARAGDLVPNAEESKNPSVGVIICSNLVMAGLESLLAEAVEQNWLQMDEEGHILVDETELDPKRQYTIKVDYSQSEVAKAQLTSRSPSKLSLVIREAEEAYQELLESEAHDAYQLALQVSGDHSIFAPEDIAPLVAENPLLLGLRPDELMDDELFEGDPPAGIIISGHLTNILLEQLLSMAEEMGALARDGAGHIIVPEGDEDNPVIH